MGNLVCGLNQADLIAITKTTFEYIFIILFAVKQSKKIILNASFLNKDQVCQHLVILKDLVVMKKTLQT